MEKFSVTLQIENYKNIKDFQKTLSGDVVLVSGNNDTGKTSLVKAIEEAWLFASNSAEPLTRGESEGFKNITIDMGGDTVTIYHKFDTNNPKGMFYAIKDGKIINNAATLRKYIGTYAPITVEQFFADMKYAESRRRLVKNYLLPLIGDEKAFKIEVINKKINEGGSLYKERTAINTDLKYREKSVQEISDEDKTLLSREDEIKPAIQKYKDQLAELSSKEAVKIAYDNLIANLNVCIESSTKVDNYEDFKADIVSAKNKVISIYSDNFSAGAISKREAEITNIQTRISAGENALLKVSAIKENLKTFESNKKAIEDLKVRKDEIETEIENLKAERQQIIASAGLPSGLETDGENITLNGFDFAESQVSYSSAAIAIAEIMAQLFTGKILVLGNINEFGPEKRQMIFDLAKKFNKMVVVTEVTSSDSVNAEIIER